MSDPLPTAERDVVEEELVCYLDDELSEEAALRVEERLRTDSQFRQRLADLERTWDMLDELPSVEVNESFTRSTIEVVALSATEDVDRRQSRVALRRWVALGVSLVVGGVAAGFGFLMASDWFSQPNEQLVEDLPVIENVDTYRRAESVEFLRQLKEEGLFTDEELDDEL